MSEKENVRKIRTVASFLKRTFQLLNDEQEGAVVQWAINGVGFYVLNEERFSQEILPKYFKHSNYSSFVRQLNMYNFHKIREHHSENYFYHPCFDRQNPHKLIDIKRKPEKKKKRQHQSEDESNEHQDSFCFKVKTGSTIPKPTEKDVKSPLLEKDSCFQKADKRMEEMSQDDSQGDRVSLMEGMNNIPQIAIPRLATCQLMFPSSNNLFPFGGKGQTSTFCLFF